MENMTFNQLLLQTAFSCMASDGHIDPSEIQLIKSLEEEQSLFGVAEIEKEINLLVTAINKKKKEFLKEYLGFLGNTEFTESEQIQIVKTAVLTIKADKEEKYSEIKFFKIIRSKLSVSNQKLIQMLPEFTNLEEDYLQQDIISDSYIDQLTVDYFNNHDIPTFSPIETGEA